MSPSPQHVDSLCGFHHFVELMLCCMTVHSPAPHRSVYAADRCEGRIRQDTADAHLHAHLHAQLPNGVRRRAGLDSNLLVGNTLHCAMRSVAPSGRLCDSAEMLSPLSVRITCVHSPSWSATRMRARVRSSVAPIGDAAATAAAAHVDVPGPLAVTEQLCMRRCLGGDHVVNRIRRCGGSYSALCALYAAQRQWIARRAEG